MIEKQIVSIEQPHFSLEALLKAVRMGEDLSLIHI